MGLRGKQPAVLQRWPESENGGRDGFYGKKKTKK
jgi:hypothetical protein